MKCTLPLALTFLTSLPWPGAGRRAETPDLARSLFWFPWVGALLGLIFCGAWRELLQSFPPAAASAILLSLTVILTRGLHLDGLADTADGLGGGRDPEEILRIMKDSRLGTFGAVAVILVLLLKFALFQAWAGPGRIFLLYPVVSRWGMVFLAYLSPYARPEGGLGQAMTQGAKTSTLAGATVSAAALSFLTYGIQGLILLTGAGVTVWLLCLYFDTKLGGVTGDVLGATGELLEVLVLAGALLFSPSGEAISWTGLFW
jgi:adenosylcobinamide-GDP ribazoletransferase